MPEKERLMYLEEIDSFYDLKKEQNILKISHKIAQDPKLAVRHGYTTNRAKIKERVAARRKEREQIIQSHVRKMMESGDKKPARIEV